MPALVDGAQGVSGARRNVWRLKTREESAAAGEEARRRWRELLADVGNSDDEKSQEEEDEEEAHLLQPEDESDDEAAEIWWKMNASPAVLTNKKAEVDSILLVRRVLSFAARNDDFSILSLLTPVDRFSTHTQLEKAYKRLALQIHPDKLHTHFEAATKAFQAATEAYQRCSALPCS